MDEKTMAKVLLSCYPYLESVFKTLQACADECIRGGFYSTEDALTQLERLDGYLARRAGIVNLKVLTDRALQHVPPKNRYLLYEYCIKGNTLDTMIRKCDLKPRTVFYRLERGYAYFMEGIKREGYTVNKIQKEYSSEPFFTMMTEKVEEQGLSTISLGRRELKKLAKA